MLSVLEGELQYLSTLDMYFLYFQSSAGFIWEFTVIGDQIAAVLLVDRLATTATLPWRLHELSHDLSISWKLGKEISLV
jgi:hypothetical protein